MDFVTLCFMAVALAMDAFTVALTSGMAERHAGPLKACKLALFFGGFQFVMPVAGWVLGSFVSAYIGRFAHWLVFALLGFIGLRMALDSIKGGVAEGESRLRPFSAATLLVMAFATSIDALAAGLSFAFMQGSIWFCAAVIGLVAFLFSFAGVFLGKRIGMLFRRHASLVGGCILMLIGLKILLEGLAG